MIRHLNANISFCELDGRLFFLDIQNDRYFQVSRALEHTLLRYLDAPSDTGIDTSGLAKHKLLPQITTILCDRSVTDIAIPTKSVLEKPSSGGTPLDVVRDVYLAVAMMCWRLKTRRLKPILQALVDYRKSRASPHVDDTAELQQCLSEAATNFNRVRPYVPIEMCCLIDSLSMVSFLAKRGLHSHLVMGVACDPFSAHAWVQHGPLVLNETVGNAHACVPIRVI